MNLDFTEKNYLLTGASSGIGKCIANTLLSNGANIIAIGRNQRALSEIVSSYPKSLYYEYNLSDISEIKNIFNFLEENNFKLDGFVHSAGICNLMTIADNDIDKMLEMYNINFFSFMEMLKYFIHPTYSNNNSSVVIISSSTAETGTKNRQSIYSATKASLNIAMKCAVNELSHRGIRINSILPSVVETELVKELRKKSSAIDMNIQYKQPFGILNPIDIANVVLFLLSDLSNGMSGVNVSVNNGEMY